MQDPVAVLVVDDNTDFLRVAAAILEEINPAFAVHAARNAAEALAFLDRRPPFTGAPRPAFILLDFQLPDMNAPAVLDWIRAHEELRGIPVLVLSQADWEEDEAAAKAAGATQFAVKPSRVQPLRNAVAAFWKEHVLGRDDLARRG